MVPANPLDRPIVALDPTTQYTFDACPPFAIIILEEPPVIIVLTAWKTHRLPELPAPSRVSTPDPTIDRVPGPGDEQYTPGASVKSDKSPVAITDVHVNADKVV